MYIVCMCVIIIMTMHYVQFVLYCPCFHVFHFHLLSATTSPTSHLSQNAHRMPVKVLWYCTNEPHYAIHYSPTSTSEMSEVLLKLLRLSSVMAKSEPG